MNTIFHVDANSAYLSWSAVHSLQQGNQVDLRTIPSVVGGDELSRHGIVLAKSMSAKPYRIQTGEPLRDALAKCPSLVVVSPDYDLYMKASNAMVEILRKYSPGVQRFSVDECFLDYTNMESHFGDPIEAANDIRIRIKQELGFTVNIGISSNKILAKMASDFTKPDKVHTLYPSEIGYKMWPLPVRDLFMVGIQTEKKLFKLGIRTIGQLANADTQMLYSHFKSYAYMIQNYANGIDSSPIRNDNREIVKGIGNSTTVPFNVEDSETAYKVLISLSESVGMRLREAKLSAGLISISICTSEFHYLSHQRKLDIYMDSTSYIVNICKQLFNELWNGSPIRKLGVRVSELCCNDYDQLSLLEFGTFNFDKHKQIDKSIDKIRGRYGTKSIFRASLLHSGLSPVIGGTIGKEIGEEEYPVMTNIL